MAREFTNTRTYPVTGMGPLLSSNPATYLDGVGPAARTLWGFVAWVGFGKGLSPGGSGRGVEHSRRACIKLFVAVDPVLHHIFIHQVPVTVLVDVKGVK